MRVGRSLSILTIAAALALAPLSAATAQQADQPPVLRPAAAALNNPLEPGTYPGDNASGPVVVVFSNSSFTDPLEEDWDIATVLLPGASQMRVTDGGDASAATWTSILAGADVLVLPEGANWDIGGTSAISDAALEIIRTWVSAGRVIVGTGSYTHGAIVSELTGQDFTVEFGNNDSNGPWQRVSGDEALTAELPNGNYTGGLEDYSLFSDDQKALITPLYFSAANDNLGMGSFAIGTGAYIYLAYDWFPDVDELVDGVRDAWNGALGISAGAVPPEVVGGPQLAATGGEAAPSVALGAISLLLLGALALAVSSSRRRVTA